jgi:peptidoglycan/xylan/chitin deacetylase (PgdA/CDA1 family)
MLDRCIHPVIGISTEMRLRHRSCFDSPRICPDAGMLPLGEHRHHSRIQGMRRREMGMRNRYRWWAIFSIFAGAMALADIPGNPPDDRLPPDRGAETDIVLPILTYHLLGVRAHQSTEATRLTVTPGNFTRQMRCLAANGYHTIALTDLAAYLRGGKPLPPRAVVLTFDDGWRDQYDVALPVLRKTGLTATFFVVSDYVGHPEFMSWAQLRTLARAGMSIGSHSHSHADLTQITDWNLLRDELVLSKSIIERNTGHEVEVFAYPYGAYDDQTIAAVEQAGYVAARADRPGVVHGPSNLYALRTLDAPNDLADFENALSAPGICARQT